MSTFLSSALKQFSYYRQLGTNAMLQCEEPQLFQEPAPGINSMAVVVKHMHGNMLSRWTDFLTTDGEKEWRKRDDEFEPSLSTSEDVFNLWNEGWKCLFDAIEPLTDEHLEQLIYIRNEGHTVTEAITRQLCHYAYHTGQIVYLAKIYKGEAWQSLSIPRGGSAVFNAAKFNQEKGRRHFTDNPQ